MKEKVLERLIDFYWYLEDLFCDTGGWFGDKAHKLQDERDLKWAQETFKKSGYRIIKKL